MPIHRPLHRLVRRCGHRPRRPLTKLSLCLVCAALTSCELPHAIAADQPFVPVLASPSRPPVVMVLNAPVPLPRWVEAAAAASPAPHFQDHGAPVSNEPAAATATPPVADTPVIVPPSPPPVAARKEPRDPVIRIATPTYLAPSATASPVVIPAPATTSAAPPTRQSLPGLPAVTASTMTTTEITAEPPAVQPAAPKAAAVPPPPSLQVSGGRFAGMPLPNLPPLTPEPDPVPRDPAAPAALQTARNEDAPAPRAAAASQVDETAAAQAELRHASERTGLTALELARIEESRRLIEEGNAAMALQLTHQLNRELDAASTTYIVKDGENLWQVAEQPQVYGNAYLWPLILRANPQLRQPGDIKPGMRLRIPTHPAVLDVTDAIDYARRAGGEKMQPVREAAAP